jgi:hypothetical protein
VRCITFGEGIGPFYRGGWYGKRMRVRGWSGEMEKATAGVNGRERKIKKDGVVGRMIL